MKLIEALGLNMGKRHMISLVGGGGKTTTMFRLAEELKEQGKKVLVTTTTAIMYPKENQYDDLWITRALNELVNRSQRCKEGTITIMGRHKLDGGKMKGIEPEWVDIIEQSGCMDIILVEADGAKCKPIKAPDIYEPVIPTKSHMVIGCIGLDSYHHKLTDERVHRPQILSKLVGQNMDSVVDYNTYSKLIREPNGLFKGCPEDSERVVLFNKVDRHKDVDGILALSNQIVRDQRGVSKVLIGNVLMDNPILSVVK